MRVVGVAACKAMMLGGKSALADAELASLLAMHLGPSSRACGKLGTVSVKNRYKCVGNSALAAELQELASLLQLLQLLQLCCSALAAEL